MAHRGQSLQASYNRKREIENIRYQQTEALSRYYNHWDKVNSRFNNWTTSKYYQKADAKLQKIKESKEKEMTMNQRRHQLRMLFADEKSIYDVEMREREKPKARRIPADNETLMKIQKKIRDEENLKKRLDLEAKLYGKWRHGVDDDKLLFESKTDNETMAKLNWLDKKIEDQTQREMNETAEQERKLRLQEEIVRTEELQKERQKVREKEIQDIRALQERHIDELKERQSECDLLKNEEKRLRSVVDDIDKELELLGESSAIVLEPPPKNGHNLKKVKQYLRNRCDIFGNHIKVSIDMLERFRNITNKPQEVAELLKKYRQQYEIEKLTAEQIDAMYESEAKYNLQRCEEAWQTQLLDRYQEIKDLMKQEQIVRSDELNENLKHQTDVVEVRSTHLSSIENSNDKLKQLLKEEENSPRPSVNRMSLELLPTATSSQTANVSCKTLALDSVKNINVSNTFDSTQTASILSHKNDFALPNFKPSKKLRPSVTFAPSTTSLPKVTNSFQNLNLDIWQETPSSISGGINETSVQNPLVSQVASSNSTTRPLYGRKRIAWS